MRLQGGRVTVVTVTVMVSLVCAARALGATYCVKAPGCTGTQEAGVQAALDAAASNSGPDIIRVGPGTYHGPFTDNPGNTVTLTGAGDRTVFDNPSGSTSVSPTSTLVLQQSTSTFSKLTVMVPAGAFGTGIAGIATVDHVLVRDVASDTADVGLRMAGGSLLHSRIVIVGSASGAAPVGISAGGLIQDDLVHMLTPGARGIEVLSFDSSEARQVTLVGPGDSATGPTDSASRGVSVDPLGAGFNTSASVTLDGVIVSGFAHPLVADGSQTPNTFCGSPPCIPASFDNVATINVSYSDFDPGNDIVGSVDSSIHQGPGTINVAPGFKDPGAGDYSLRRGSAVIDHGDPAVPRTAGGRHPADSTTDLAGNPRRSDGNGDGIARVDIGAFEYTNLVPVAIISAPATALLGKAVHLTGSSSHDADGDPLTFLWHFGDGNQSAAANPTHTYFKAGTYTVTLVVTDAIRAHSAPAVRQIRITRPCIVPKLHGEGLRAAKRDLLGAHCSLGKITRRHSRRVGQGRVISSTPSAGTELATGAPVAVTVSRGR